MILYFSGTGNSRFIAEKLAELLHDTLFSMESNAAMPLMKDEESLGIIFPVYAWGVPRVVENFLKDKTITNRYVWTVMTCGDDMGYTDVILSRILRRKVDAAFSLFMPNTYICLPGFDVDNKEVAERKVADTLDRLLGIAESIGRKEVRSDLHRGDAAWIKTYILRPLFNRFLVTDKYFTHTSACNSCGLCAKQCPVGDIVITKGSPTWQHNGCTGCLRCYHNCPRHAIEWGSFTKGKGQKKHL